MLENTNLALTVLVDLLHTTVIKLADTLLQLTLAILPICDGNTTTMRLLLVYPACIFIL